MSTGGACETAVAVRIRCMFFNLMKCNELLYGKRFPLRLKMAVSGNNLSNCY